jgi:hypothetical protein
MSSLATFDPPTFVTKFQRVVAIRQSAVRSHSRLFARFNDSREEFDRCAGSFAGIVADYQRRFVTPPRILPAGADVAARPYDEAAAILDKRLEDGVVEFQRRLTAARVCCIEWLDESTCRFTYNALSTVRGILNHAHIRVSHAHELVDARAHRLPARDVPKPRAATDIIGRMPPLLADAARIITGTLIVESASRIEQFHEPTILGSALSTMTDLASRAARRAASFAARGIENISSSMSRQVLKRDPAIIVGEFCLFGWED